MPPLVGYWSVRGRCESIWYLLEYCGVEYQEKRYQFYLDPNESVDKSARDKFGVYKAWLKEKPTLGLDFPNLPYFIDGDVKLTQTVTILRYLAQKHNLLGSTEEEKLRAELAEQQLLDLRNNFILFCYQNNLEELLGGYGKTLPETFQQWSKFLDDRKFLAGNDVTYVDFLAYDAFDFHRLVFKNCLSAFPNLEAYLCRIEALPAMNKYMMSERFVRWPVIGPLAKVGGDGQPPATK